MSVPIGEDNGALMCHNAQKFKNNVENEKMYIGQRDKLISIRVSSKLLAEFQKVVDSRTKVYGGRGGRKLYDYSDPERRNHHYSKFTVSDLLEEAMIKYVEGDENKPRGAM